MMFQRYILVVLAFTLCLVAATPVLVDSAVRSQDGSTNPTTYQAALSRFETGELSGEVTLEEGSGSK